VKYVLAVNPAIVLYRVIKDWDVQDHIRQTVAEHHGDLKTAAQALKMTAAELERKIKKMGLRDEG
jgi:DNA-binding NtrC family response regulator